MQKLNDNKICWPGNRFVPCTGKDSLLETVIAAVNSARAGVADSRHLFAFSKTDRQKRQRICPKVKSISWGWSSNNPKILVKTSGALSRIGTRKRK